MAEGVAKASPRSVGITRELLEEALTPERIDEFARKLYLSAVSIYRQTILELANERGADRTRIHLSIEVRNALMDEARWTAEAMLRSHNRDLRSWIARNRPGKPDALFLTEGMEWARRRRQTHARIAAQTLAYTAHADATLGFWKDVGEEPLFDFGGHGDAPPKCAICRALVQTNPHPIARVVEIGIPHPQCRQTWHTETEITVASRQPLGRSVGGILGQHRTWLDRNANRDDAADAIRSLPD